ncbi:hypothetical protein SUGI_0569260 [Cryptomeria japonica]|uniref:protein CLT2, chloroplastic n=1 Tax=Cryptomeria japonica TaxID=3369 RepID=UPI002408BCD4|nr:protein CLT2, chloroplastic [Cryptomeria japonica]GLJ28881.1 hypothetical protein SUGI_0569260 [Cryptomeria japonica]
MAIILSVRIPICSHCNSYSLVRPPIKTLRKISVNNGIAGTVLFAPKTLKPSNRGSQRAAKWWGTNRHGSLGGCQRGCPILSGVQASSLEMDASLESQKKIKILTAAAVTVAFAVANRVLYKLALVPLKDYPFFLAQLTTFGYVLVYFSILYVRYRMGIVTDEMLAFPKLRFVAVGALEALGVASGMAAGANLSGASIPILSQTFLVWQLILSVLFLGRRYTVSQLFGCLLVAAGVIMAVSSGAGTSQLLEQAGLFWPLLMMVSSLFQAGASILKESVFIDSAKHLKAESIDIFVVNSFGSGFQALFVFLLLPFLSKLKGIPFSQLPSYLKDGAACFVNMGSISKSCVGAPLLPLLFITVNMCFNISLLRLVKMSSAVISSLSATLAVPISIYVFTLPLPYIGAEPALPPTFILGAAILVFGLVIYNLRRTVKDATKEL